MSPKTARGRSTSLSMFSDSACVGFQIVVAKAMIRISKKGVVNRSRTCNLDPIYFAFVCCIASYLHAMDMVTDAKAPKRSTTSSASLCTSYL